MLETLDEFFAEKHSIINELYIATADHNYILARWCFHQHLNVDFFWLAVHSVEKYLKAVLLMNGKSAKKYGHDITKLYAAVTPLAPELFPTTLAKPDDRMPVEYWNNESVEKFIARLYRDGQAKDSPIASAARLDYALLYQHSESLTRHGHDDVDGSQPTIVGIIHCLTK